ncbi:hypothetical protein E2542_SST13822 [Spatholobus suberectus]|nr:hypothetical protein E2542_SST13822 [Spatholobus suberectus]
MPNLLRKPARRQLKLLVRENPQIQHGHKPVLLQTLPLPHHHHQRHRHHPQNRNRPNHNPAQHLPIKPLPRRPRPRNPNIQHPVLTINSQILEIRERPVKIPTQPFLESPAHAPTRTQTLALAESSGFSSDQTHVPKPKPHSAQIFKLVTPITRGVLTVTAFGVITGTPPAAIRRVKPGHALTQLRHFPGANPEATAESPNLTHGLRFGPEHVPGAVLAGPRVLPHLPEGLQAEHRGLGGAFGEPERGGGREGGVEVEAVDVGDGHLGDVGEGPVGPVPGGPVRDGVVEDELDLAVERRPQPQGVEARGGVGLGAPGDEGVEAREVHAGEPGVGGGVEALPRNGAVAGEEDEVSGF